MRIDDRGRPGLLLVCHGDVPEALLEDPECYGLYRKCLSECGQMAGTLEAIPVKDEISGFSSHVASFLSAGADGPVEMAFMGFRKPGIREAMYRAMSAGARSIVCVGAGGLMMPGSGATSYLPAAIEQVMATNPGLDVFYARPGMNKHMVSSIVMASVESALAGPGIAPRPSGDMPRIGGETGVIVVSSHDQLATSGASTRQSASFIAAVKGLSDYARARSDGSGTEIARFMSGISACLEASGAFCGVQAGCLDFSGQSLEAAADRLIRAGSRQDHCGGHASAYASPYALVG